MSSRGSASQSKPERAYHDALGSGHPDWSVRAGLNLALLQIQLGQEQAAEAVLAPLVRAEGREVSARARLQLANLRAGQDRVEEAAAGYLRLIEDHDDPDGDAHLNLGVLLDRKGDGAAAREHYAVVLRLGAPRQAAEAAFNMGVSLSREDDLAGAETWFRQAADGPVGELRLRGLLALGTLLSNTGRHADAERAFRSAADADEDRPGADGSLALGVFLYRLGELDEAATHLERAVRSPDPGVTTTAQLALGEVRWLQGRPGEAEGLLRVVIEAGDAELRTTAAVAPRTPKSFFRSSISAAASVCVDRRRRRRRARSIDSRLSKCWPRCRPWATPDQGRPLRAAGAARCPRPRATWPTLRRGRASRRSGAALYRAGRADVNQVIAADFRVDVEIEGQRTPVLTEQMYALDRQRIGRWVGRLTHDELRTLG